jgi:hypothetical protein
MHLSGSIAKAGHIAIYFFDEGYIMSEQKAYRVGWVIPNQVAGLTHYTPEVTLDEFQSIAGESNAMLNDIDKPFHIVIDNRIMNMAFLPDLQALQGAAPYMSNPYLRHVVMIKPQVMEGLAKDLPSYTDGNITLTYVDEIQDVVDLLKAADGDLRWHMVEADFFPDARFE